MTGARQTFVQSDRNDVLRRSPTLALLAIVTLVGAAFAYARVHTGFAPWDDEGYMMGTVKQVRDGHRLYSEVLSSYGPFYYLYAVGLRVLTATPVEHDVVRLSALLPWLATPLVVAWIVLRMTRSLPLVALAYGATIQSLVFIQREPGHPQELCVLLLAMLLAASMYSPRQRSVAFAAGGLLVGTLVLTKINLGIFVFVATGLAIVACLPRSAAARALVAMFAAAGIALPVILMRDHLHDVHAQVYCTAVTTGVLGACLALARNAQPGHVRWRECTIAAAAFGASLLVAAAALAMWGVPLSVASDNLIAMNARIYAANPSWYVPPDLLLSDAAWAGAGLVGALACARLPDRMLPATLAVLKLIVGIGTLVTIVFASRFRPGMAIAFAAPFCWLVLFPAANGLAARYSFARAVLGLVTVMQMLYAYPIAGSQLGFVRMAMVPVATVCIFDAACWLERQSAATALGTTVRHASGATVLIASLGALCVAAWDAVRDYEALPSLGLPGAMRVHVRPEVAAQLQGISGEIRAHCDALFGYPSMPSLAFWGGMENASAYVTGNWMIVLTAEQQRDVIAGLERFPDACIVHNGSVVAFWNRGGDDQTMHPLVRYIESRFTTTRKFGDYDLKVRNSRAQALGSQ